MKTVVYNKLIRDKIPEHIEADGGIAHLRTLSDAEYRAALIAKLREETEEYAQSAEPEELADICEVLLALIADAGIDLPTLEKIRLQKQEKNGAFAKKLLLTAVERPE